MRTRPLSCGSPAISRCRSRNCPPTSRPSIRKSFSPTAWPTPTIRRGGGTGRRSLLRHLRLRSRRRKGQGRRRRLRPQLAAVEGEAGDAAAGRRSGLARTRHCKRRRGQVRRCWRAPTAARAGKPQAQLCGRGRYRPLRRVRGARRSRKHHAATQEDSRHTTGASVSSSSKKSETVGSILRELGAAPDEIKALLRRARRPRLATAA